MKYARFVIIMVLVCSFLLLFACSSSSGISGEYVCTEHYTESMEGQLSLDFQSGGTVLMKPLNSEGKYSVDGDTVTVKLDQFDLTFTIDGQKLVSADKTVVYEKQ